MPVVSDTLPICNLAIIGRLDLLRVQFGEVTIPEAVMHELDHLSHVDASNAIQHAIREGWLRIHPLENDRVARLLEASLDPGEAAAIALALETSADRLLLDERDGRVVANQAGLHVTGVLGVLLRAKIAGRIKAVKPELEALRTRARFFVSSQIE